MSCSPKRRLLAPRTLSATALDAVAGGYNIRSLDFSLPDTAISPRGSIDAERAGDLQAAQYLHADPRLDAVSYSATGPNQFALGSYTRSDLNHDFAERNVLVRNGEVIDNREGSVADRFSGLEAPPNFSTGSAPETPTFDERFSGNGGNSGQPSWLPQEYGNSFSSAASAPSSPAESGTRSIGEGGDSGPGYTQTFDDGSTLTQDSSGGYSSTPSTDDGSSYSGEE